jgi:triosephosphate isomerase
LYGGSCNTANAEALFSQPNIWGGLIGGASLEPDSFKELIAIGKKIIL